MTGKVAVVFGGSRGIGGAIASRLARDGFDVGQATVLVVDDDPTLQRMILDYFVDNNIQTLLASGREEMLRQLSARKVNVVILDLRLGLEDGLDALRELRSSFDVPVIILTGHRRDEIDRVVGLELGADDYMRKPFNLRELLARYARSFGGWTESALRLNTSQNTAAIGFPTGSSICALEGLRTRMAWTLC
jgi:CheY-like chemotaxis protein